ncbi:hypothetical protein ACFYWP_07005 [Actinacidiphila glaucinigra]|uniref:hypothetical protein n=1 Tax=Actinacidiphila glaucinigra TaxID=235986 RepID=UPI0036CFAF18
MLLAVAVVAVALLARSGEKMREGSRIPAYDVTYTVTGTAPVSVSVSGGDGMTLRGGELAPSELPWTKRVSMPADGTPPTMEILLDEKGGRAECALSVHDRLVSRSVAEGVFGRATCGATAPTTAPPASPAT